MHPNTIKPYINLMLFSMIHDMTGTACVERSDGLLDLINLSLEPFGCSASPFKKKCIDNTVYRWTTEVIGPILQGGTSVTLTVEIVPWAKRWQVFATFNPGNNGQSDIFDALKDNNICGDGFVYHMVYNIAHRANIRLVQDRLSPGQKVTFSFDSLFASIKGTPGTRYTREGVLMGSPLYDKSQYAVDGQPVAEHLDELTVIEVASHGDVTFKGPKDIPFTLDAEETIAAIPELQV
jgi:hypothetical protein